MQLLADWIKAKRQESLIYVKATSPSMRALDGQLRSNQQLDERAIALWHMERLAGRERHHPHRLALTNCHAAFDPDYRKSFLLVAHRYCGDNDHHRCDTLKVQVTNSSGTVLATLATYSNVNHNAGYV
jgi:hypothetical protein